MTEGVIEGLVSFCHTLTSDIQFWGPQLIQQAQPLSCLPWGCPRFPGW